MGKGQLYGTYYSLCISIGGQGVVALGLKLGGGVAGGGGDVIPVNYLLYGDCIYTFRSNNSDLLYYRRCVVGGGGLLSNAISQSHMYPSLTEGVEMD